MKKIDWNMKKKSQKVKEMMMMMMILIIKKKLKVKVKVIKTQKKNVIVENVLFVKKI